MPETPALWTEIERPSVGLVVVRCHGRLVWGEEDQSFTGR